MAGCRCTPEPIARREGRTVWLGQAHHPSCSLKVFLLKRLAPLDLKLAERAPDAEGTGYTGHLDGDDPRPPSDQRFADWESLSDQLKADLVRFSGSVAKIGSDRRGVGLYVLVPAGLQIPGDRGDT